MGGTSSSGSGKKGPAGSGGASGGGGGGGGPSSGKRKGGKKKGDSTQTEEDEDDADEDSDGPGPVLDLRSQQGKRGGRASRVKAEQVGCCLRVAACPRACHARRMHSCLKTDPRVYVDQTMHDWDFPTIPKSDSLRHRV